MEHNRVMCDRCVVGGCVEIGCVEIGCTLCNWWAYQDCVLLGSGSGGIVCCRALVGVIEIVGQDCVFLGSGSDGWMWHVKEVGV